MTGILGVDYPTKWEEFVGQDHVKFQLKVLARSAKKRNARMQHILISCPVPGVGKTSLAILAAIEREKNVRVMTDIRKEQVPDIFDDMGDGDVLFIDEIHKLVDGGKKNAEWLYHYMQDGVLMTRLGPEKAPNVTIIGATTDAGVLPPPLVERFEAQPELKPYTDEQGVQIVQQLGRRVLVPEELPLPTEEIAAAIARAANNRPRIMRRVLVALRDLACADELDPCDGRYDLVHAFPFAGVTSDGLSAQAQAYLRSLARDFKGRPGGRSTIAERIGEVARGMGQIEDLLLEKGLIALTLQGRMLTSAGRRRARELLTEEDTA